MSNPACRGVRGATTITGNTREAVLAGTRELLEQLVKQNDIAIDDIAAAFFTTSPDLTAAFPAVAARELGWVGVALLGAQEADVENGLAKCVRVLILWNTDKTAQEISHVYLEGADVLRPDRRS